MTLHNVCLPIAYIDPGSGAMLLQWIIAGVIGAGIYFRRFIGKVLRKIAGRKDTEDTDSGEDKKR